MNEQQRFLMMVGLPASGKSTIAMELMEGRNDIVYLSSDELRKELLGSAGDQSGNTEVFEEMRNRTRQALKDGKHVIYDATNISRKRRRGLLRQLPRDVYKIVFYVSTEYRDVVEQNEERDRVVPIHVIDKMYKTMQIPIYSEGWDKIYIHHHDNVTNSQYPKQFTDAVRAGILFGREGYDLIKFLASYFDEFFKIYDMPQDSKYHSFSVSRHTYYVYRYILENYDAKDDEDMEVMLWAGLLHDIGKGFCKSFYNRKGEETKYANFIGHEYVGSQIAVHFLHKMNYEDEFIHKVVTLIQFHMYLLNEKASRSKLKDYVGDELYEKLEILREADTLAH